MSLFEKEFNELIVSTFHLILKEEMRFVTSLTNYDLSAREIHLIENVGKSRGKIRISDVAEALQITLASITVMVNKLEKQGYLIKKKDELDARQVRLDLTEKGIEIDNKHSEFHGNMVKKIIGNLSDNDRDMLAGAVKKLNEFFQNDFRACSH